MQKCAFAFALVVASIVSGALLSITPFNTASGVTYDIIHYSAPPTLHNMAGQAIDSIVVGQQALVRVSVQNNEPTERSLVIIVEVRNGNGVTEYLAYQSNRIASNSNYTMEISWRPDRICPDAACNENYVIRSFAITDFENPQVLSAPYEYEGITLIKSRDGNKIYNLTIDGRVYELEYSIDSGYIKSAGIYSEPATLEAMLDGVSKDTNLIIQLSRALAIEAFSCVEEPAAEVGEPIVFVDSTETASLVDIHNDKSMTLEIALIAGSENVEILGRCLI